jgi:SOS response associated peptidase (SRAP)
MFFGAPAFGMHHKGRMQTRLSAFSSAIIESSRSSGGSDSELRRVRTTSEEELARRCHTPIPLQRDLPISWNIAPTQDVLAIRFNPETKQRTLDALRWGLNPYWAKDPKIAYKTINARVETVDAASSYRQALKKPENRS